SFSERHCKHGLTRAPNGGTTDDHAGVEAQLVTWGGLFCSLRREVLEDPPPDPTQQGCEWEAFPRVASRLYQRCPRVPIGLSLEGLFACGPVFARCHDDDGRYGIVLKERDLPSASHEFLGLATLPPEGRLKEPILNPVEINREFRWRNGIEDCDSQDRQPLLNVIERTEPNHQDGQPQTTRLRGLTDLAINQGQVREVAPSAGRARWKLENPGFHSQKRGGFALEHLDSHDSKAAKVF